MVEGLTYKSAGVDVQKIRAAQGAIGKIISSTHRIPGGSVVSGFGHYAGLIKFGSQTLALHTDGVGTKVMVAQQAHRFDTIGIDCIAMNVNDIICVGARPLAFVDYIALAEPNDALLSEVMRGLVAGAKLADMAIIGGETAILPDLLREGENTFDLAGTALGSMEGRKPLLGAAISEGDVILGVESSGLHSNGYTLARKVLLSKYSLDDNAEFMVQTVGEELLIPTRIYVKPVLELLKNKTSIHGFANITGGSFGKISRLNDNVDYVLDGLPEPHGIFRQIQYDGGIEQSEMYRTFNMGVGFCVICRKAQAESVIRCFTRHKMRCWPIGKVAKGKGRVVAVLDGKKVVL